MKKFDEIAITLSLGDGMSLFRKEVEQKLLNYGVESDAAAEMIISLNEATMNIVRHGYQDQGGPVEVLFYRQAQSLFIELRDHAPLFDPTTFPTPDITVPLAIRPLGGMGVHMMREFTDGMTYRQTEDGRNQLTFIKRHAFA